MTTQIRRKKFKSESLLFFICFVPFFWAKLIQLTTLIDYPFINQTCGLAIRLFGLLNLCTIVLCKLPRRKFLVFVCCFLLFVLSGYLSDDWQFIWTIGFIITAHNCDFNKIAKVTFISYSFILLATFVLSSGGVIVNTITYGLTRVRYGMGFIFTSIGGIIVTRIGLLLIYLKRKKINLIEITLLVGLAVFYYIKTKTRAPFVIIILLVFIVYSTKWFDKLFKSKFWKWIVQYCVVIAPAIAFASVLLYNPSNSILNVINLLFSSRLSITKRTLATDGISLLGQRLTTVGTGTWTSTGEVIQEAGWLYNVVDSSYILYAMKYGVIFLLIIIVLYYICCRKSLLSNDIFLQIILVILIMYGIFEPQLFRIEYNPFILLLGDFFYEKYRYPFKHTKALFI